MKTALIGIFTLMASFGLATSAQGASLYFKAELSGDKIIGTDGNPAPIKSPGKGIANLILNDARTELAYELTLSGLALDTADGTVTRVHIHSEFPDQKRTVFHVFNIYDNTDIYPGITDDRDLDLDRLNASMSGPITFKGKWTADDFCYNTDPKTGFDCNNDPDTTKKLSDYLDELLDGKLYFNIHTSTVRSGEIRGNIELVPVPEPGTVLGLVTVVGLAGLSFRKNKA